MNWIFITIKEPLEKQALKKGFNYAYSYMAIPRKAIQQKCGGNIWNN